MLSHRFRDPYPVYLCLRGGYALFFALITTVNMIYQVQLVHLNALQLVLVGTVLEIVAFVTQVPTGVIADVYSRRMAVIVGLFLVGSGFVVEGSIPQFTAILLAQVIWGVGVTCMDGAEQAWITDEVGERRATMALLRGGQVGQVAGVVGTVVAIVVAIVTRINVPIILGGCLLVALSFVMLFVMPESRFKPGSTVSRPSWVEVVSSTRSGLTMVRGHEVVWSILSIVAISGMFSEGVDRLSTAHFLHDITLPLIGGFQPVLWLGTLGIAAMPLHVAASEILRRRLDTRSHVAVARLLLAIQGLLVAAVIGFAFAGSFAFAVAMWWVVGVLRSLQPTLFTLWLNQHIDSRVRATLLSLGGQADAVGQIAGGPLVGAIGTFASLRAALAVSGLILLPSLPIFGRALRTRSVAEDEAAPSTATVNEEALTGPAAAPE